MTVLELINRLKKLPKNLEIVLSKDSEGNDFSPLSDTSLGYYTPNSKWSGDFAAELDMEQQDIDNLKAGSEKVVCLWPTN